MPVWHDALALHEAREPRAATSQLSLAECPGLLSALPRHVAHTSPDHATLNTLDALVRVPCAKAAAARALPVSVAVCRVPPLPLVIWVALPQHRSPMAVGACAGLANVHEALAAWRCSEAKCLCWNQASVLVHTLEPVHEPGEGSALQPPLHLEDVLYVTVPWAAVAGLAARRQRAEGGQLLGELAEPCNSCSCTVGVGRAGLHHIPWCCPWVTGHAPHVGNERVLCDHDLASAQPTPE
mmetsp:Transcript_104588/g.295547  ORF Transcript_104588/g.295547 Transcript_104588/m.295547 type:complete len:239 (+) Transcript_104588:173-889(+)